MITSNPLVTGEALAKSYGFKVQSIIDHANSIQDFVAQGKIVGEWNGKSFQILALPEVIQKRPLRWNKQNSFSGLLKIEEIKNIWHALDYFGEGELDILSTPTDLFVFPEEGRKLIDNIRNILENKTDTKIPQISDYNFQSDDPFLNNLQGKLMVLEGNVSEAGKSFGKALAALPEYSEPYANLGTMLWQLGQKKEAFTLFVEALLRNPHNNAAQLNFFDAGRELEEFDSIIKVVEKLLSLDPDCIEFYPIMAFSYYRLGQAGKAIDILNQFLNDHPGEEEARLLLEHIKGHVG